MMSPVQIERQLAYLVAAQVWPDSPAATILAGGVVVSAKPAAELVGKLSTPFGVVRSSRLVPDPIIPVRFQESTFDLELAAEVWADEYGHATLVGANRESVGQSGGRGLRELVDEIRNQINGGLLVDSTHGMQGYLEVTETPRRVPGKDGGVVYAFQTIHVRVFGCPSARFYHQPIRLLATGGSGQVALSWTLPPDRFDRLKVILRRASGSTPPSSVSSGTGVTLSASLATSKTDTGLSPGTYSYSLFGAYDETHSPVSTEERYSAAATATSITVT